MQLLPMPSLMIKNKEKGVFPICDFAARFHVVMLMPCSFNIVISLRIPLDC